MTLFMTSWNTTSYVLIFMCGMHSRDVALLAHVMDCNTNQGMQQLLMHITFRVLHAGLLKRVVQLVRFGCFHNGL